ncbi:MAG TPA: VWA domain-containing protein [Solirubrobacteraceae bacterium]|nr:VWA domain-containing protein [Solirubrobacteraceae bacterium]
MSFQTPVWLVALALVPLAVAAYVWARRRRGARYAVRFPAVATLREAMGTAPGWERHIPAALALLAAGLLVVALARPRMSYSAPVHKGSVMLVTDHSGSMAANDVTPSRLAAAQAAANRFIDQLPATVRLGAVAFSSSADAAQAPVFNHAAARAIINGQTANGGTDTGGALQLALQLLHGSDRSHPPAVIVLLSDGAANAGPNPVTVGQQARQEHIPIFTVALGTPNGVLPSGNPFAPSVPVPPDPQLMQEIASVSGGRAFNAHSSDELSAIYHSLGTQLGSVTRQREITAVFAIAGLVVLVGAVGASVRWWGRVPA